MQTFAAHGHFGTSVITALTVQSTLGVAEVQIPPKNVLTKILSYLEADLPAEGIKVGMLGDAATVQAVYEYLQTKSEISGKPNIPIVLDPVLRSSSGADLLSADGLLELRERLLPQVGWITPNWSELNALTGLPVTSLAEAEAAAVALGRLHPRLHVVVTGGELETPVDLLRLPSGELHRFAGEHVATRSTHGTGCAFSAALLSRLMLGDRPVEAVGAAKQYVAEALRRAPGLGHGRGPLDLLWPLRQGGR